MPLSANDLAHVRAELGDDTPPTDADLNATFDRLGDVGATILEWVDHKLANMLDGPSSFSVPGQYSESNGEVILALERKAKRYRDGGGTLTTGKLFRPDRRRRPLGGFVGDDRILPS